MKCMLFIEKHAEALRKMPDAQRRNDKESAAVITIQGSGIRMTPVGEMVQHTDSKNRRGIHSWWEGFKELAEKLGGRTDLAAAC
jgi:6-phosphofructokinase 1